MLVGCDNYIHEDKQKWLIEKAKDGDLSAMDFIVKTSHRGLRDSVGDYTINRYRQTLINAEYIPALISEAFSHEDYESQSFWLKKAADKGSEKAMYYLYELYKDPKNIRHNESLANDWLRKAANAGHLNAKKIVRKIDGIEVSLWTSTKEDLQFELSMQRGNMLGAFCNIVMRGAPMWIAGGIVILSMGKIWIGLLLLLAFVLFVVIYVIAYIYYSADYENGNFQTDVGGWLTIVYVLWGSLIPILSGLGDMVPCFIDFSYNVGRLTIAEGTFGFGPKLAVFMTWTLLLISIWAVYICVKQTPSKQLKLRLCLMFLMCLYSFIMGAFLSVITFLVAVCLILKWSPIDMLRGALLNTGTSSSGSSETEYRIDGKKVEDIGVVPGTRYKDEQGNTYTNDGFGNYTKEE